MYGNLYLLSQCFTYAIQICGIAAHVGEHTFVVVSVEVLLQRQQGNDQLTSAVAHGEQLET